MEEKIKITNLEILGKLPDPFLMEDGTRISDPTQWEARRKEMYKHVVELQYGTQPPAPEFLEVELIQAGNAGECLHNWLQFIRMGWNRSFQSTF